MNSISNQEPDIEPKIKKKYVYPTRNRKEYMQKYYNAHKETVQCDMCKKYFACPMSLKTIIQTTCCALC